MTRELYIYWRVPRAQREQALQAANAFQAALLQQHPGLAARLLVRGDEGAASDTTLMEIYGHAEGVNTALQQRIDALACEQFSFLSPRPTRHVEVFVPAVHRA